MQLRPQHAGYPRIREIVGRAEDIGADWVSTWDHFFPLTGDPNGRNFECWSMIAAWAEQTKRVQIASLVSAAGYRNPDLLADMARTVDHISGGRVVLGIGAGWHERDHAEYGFDFGSVTSRIDRLAASVIRIKHRLRSLNPPPTRQIPILIGGGGERKTLRIVAEHADIWHSIESPHELARKVRILSDHCAAVGRQLDEIEFSTHVPHLPDGDVDLSAAEALRGLGVTILTVVISGPDFDLRAANSLLRWRDRQVAPGSVSHDLSY